MAVEAKGPPVADDGQRTPLRPQVLGGYAATDAAPAAGAWFIVIGCCPIIAQSHAPSECHVSFPP